MTEKFVCGHCKKESTDACYQCGRCGARICRDCEFWLVEHNSYDSDIICDECGWHSEEKYND